MHLKASLYHLQIEVITNSPYAAKIEAAEGTPVFITKGP